MATKRKAKAPATKTFIAYQVVGVGRHVSEPIPFLVTATTFTAAKEQVISEWAVRVSKQPHGFISSFFIRPGDKGDTLDTSKAAVAALFKKRMSGDRHVATVDRKRAIHKHSPKNKSSALGQGMSFVGYMSMRGQGHRWFLVPEPAYMLARAWVLAVAGKYHARYRTSSAEFGMVSEVVPESTTQAQLDQMRLSPGESLIAFSEQKGETARVTILGRFGLYRPYQSTADRDAFIRALLTHLAHEVTTP